MIVAVVMAKTKKRTGGRPKGSLGKTIAQHKIEGTYHKHRHAPKVDPLKPKPVLKKLPTKAESKRWVRNASDELALARGCRFSEQLAEYAAKWIESYLKLWEGVWAGCPFRLTPWQETDLIYPAFGWVRKRKDKPHAGRIVRRIRKIYVEIAKKGGKSPVAAAIEIHMFVGDGEAGAHTTACACDQKQAAVVHDHAIAMIEESPKILERVKINRQQHVIYMPETKSRFDVLSEEQRGAERSQGRNLHCMCYDEVHVARNDRLYTATKYAFRGRMQPLWIGLTTAGEENEGLWHDLRQYGEGVAKGDIEDIEFLPVIYRADEKDDWEAEATWRKANPSLDILLSVDELRSDAIEATKSAGALADFKRYTLNVAPGAVSDWLEAADWDQCRSEYQIEDCAGQDADSGLDLGQSGDMCAWVVTIEDPDQPGLFRQFPWIWMPEESLEKRKHLAAYEEWVRDGHLFLTEGNTIDYEVVFGTIREVAKIVNLRSIVYDPMFAESDTQRLEGDLPGIKRIQFRQTLMMYAEATRKYEELLKMKALLHPGNAVLTWQAGHVMVKTSPEGLIKPVKRKKGDHRTVDAIQGGVMALSQAMVPGAPASIYATRGMIVV